MKFTEHIRVRSTMVTNKTGVGGGRIMKVKGLATLDGWSGSPPSQDHDYSQDQSIRSLTFPAQDCSVIPSDREASPTLHHLRPPHS